MDKENINAAESNLDGANEEEKKVSVGESTDANKNNSSEDNQGENQEETGKDKSGEVDEKENKRQGYEKRQADKSLSTGGDQSTDDAVTVQDLVRQNQRQAIEAITVVTENDSDEQQSLKQDIGDNWSEVKKFFKNTSSAKIPTAEEVRQDILSAHAAFRQRSPRANTDGSEATRKVTQTGAASAGTSKPNPTGNDKKSVLPKSSSVDDWYN